MNHFQPSHNRSSQWRCSKKQLFLFASNWNIDNIFWFIGYLLEHLILPAVDFFLLRTPPFASKERKGIFLRTLRFVSSRMFLLRTPCFSGRSDFNYFVEHLRWLLSTQASEAVKGFLNNLFSTGMWLQAPYQKICRIVKVFLNLLSSNSLTSNFKGTRCSWINRFHTFLWSYIKFNQILYFRAWY